MHRQRPARIAIDWIETKEAADRRIVVPVAQVVEVVASIELLTGIEIAVRRRSGLFEYVAESVVGVAVRDLTSSVGQQSHARLTIVLIEARALCPGARNRAEPVVVL